MLAKKLNYKTINHGQTHRIADKDSTHSSFHSLSFSLLRLSLRKKRCQPLIEKSGKFSCIKKQV